MGWFDDDSDQANAATQVRGNRRVPIAHELIAAAASYEAAKAYEKHVAAEGRPDKHEEAKSILAGVVGAFVDREVEERGIPTAEAGILKAKAEWEAHRAYDEAPDDLKAKEGY